MTLWECNRLLKCCVFKLIPGLCSTLPICADSLGRVNADSPVCALLYTHTHLLYYQIGSLCQPSRIYLTFNIILFNRLKWLQGLSKWLGDGNHALGKSKLWRRKGFKVFRNPSPINTRKGLAVQHQRVRWWLWFCFTLAEEGGIKPHLNSSGRRAVQERHYGCWADFLTARPTLANAVYSRSSRHHRHLGSQLGPAPSCHETTASTAMCVPWIEGFSMKWPCSSMNRIL